MEEMTGSQRTVASAAHEFTSGSQASGAHGRLFFLDSLRAAAAIFVVLVHISETAPPPWHQLNGLFDDAGTLAVSLFLVVSGFSLGIAATRNRDGRFRTFIRRRAWRIVPPYWAALVVSIILTLTLIPHFTGAQWDKSLPLSWHGVWIAFFGVQDIFRPTKLPDYPLWSIALEWHLYFFFPLLLWITKRNFGRVLAIAVAVVAAAALWIPWNGLAYRGFPPQYVILFVLGIVASTLVTSHDATATRARQLLSPVLVTALAVGCFALAVFFCRLWSDSFVGDVIMGCGFSTLMVGYSGARRFWGRRVLECRPLVWVGFFSYSLYLIHAPLIQIVWQYVVNPLHLHPAESFIATAVLGLMAAISGAFIFHLIFERPFINYRTRKDVLAVYREPLRLLPTSPARRGRHVRTRVPAHAARTTRPS